MLCAVTAWAGAIPRTKRDSTCQGGLKSTFEYEKICEECYKVLDNPPYYQSLCKLNCYSTTFFKNCMVDLLVEDSTQERLVNELHLHHSGTQYTQEHLDNFNSETNELPRKVLFTEFEGYQNRDLVTNLQNDETSTRQEQDPRGRNLQSTLWIYIGKVRHILPFHVRLLNLRPV